MKFNLILVVAMVFVFAAPAGAWAARKRPPLRIEGVPVSGSLDRFVKRLASNGFMMEGALDSAVLMVGTWEGYRAVRLRVHGEGGEVSLVECLKETTDEWTSIESEYRSIVALLSARYGGPDAAAMWFDGRAGEVVSETAKMLCLIRGKATVYSAWDLKDGVVRVEARYEKGRYYVVTKYIPGIRTA